jgi:antitoxin HicB
MFYKIPLLLMPQPEGGFTVTSPVLPELVTEGDSVEEVMINVQDALQAVVEAYQDMGQELIPQSHQQRSLLELEGLSAEIWQGVDTQKYVDDLRNEWNHRL